MSRVGGSFAWPNLVSRAGLLHMGSLWQRLGLPVVPGYGPAVALFQRVDASDWALLGPETAGARGHSWLATPETEEAWLFKPVVVHGNRRQGEDWAEKVVAEIAQVMGVPHAQIELASRRGSLGCLSRDLKPRGWEIQPGSALLSGLIDGYESHQKGRRGHSLANVRTVLSGIGPPPQAKGTVSESAFDFFVGYLVLDALVANRDRHDDNWSILRPDSGDDCLCGSYDHASSLGFNLLDHERVRRLRDGTLPNWAARGTAVKFEHDPNAGPASLVEHARRALTMCSARAAAHWLTMASAVTREVVAQVFASLPDVSDPVTNFGTALVIHNRERLLP